MTWLRQAPPKPTQPSAKGQSAKPYPLSWAEQNRLFRLLPRHLVDAALFAVNTGCRDQEICQLRWEWEVDIPELETSSFILPESMTKTGMEHVVVLNSIARRVIASRRGIHEEYVFTYLTSLSASCGAVPGAGPGKRPGCRWSQISVKACIICGTPSGGGYAARVFPLKPAGL
jgi:integrase